jgi:peroxiredoxin Q/BCP
MTLRTWLKVAGGLVVAAVAGITGIAGWGQSAVELKVGDMAPGFNLPGSDAKTHQLSDHLGQRAVVLAWFPKAFTGG